MSERRGGSEGKKERITQECNDIKSFNKTTERYDTNASRQEVLRITGRYEKDEGNK